MISYSHVFLDDKVEVVLVQQTGILTVVSELSYIFFGLDLAL
jgi:hypothetical protein